MREELDLGTRKRNGVTMTMQDKAKNALVKARGSLDSAIGTIFGDEQLETELSTSGSKTAIESAQGEVHASVRDA